MAEGEDYGARSRRRRRRDKHKRKNRRFDSLFYELRWLLGGLAIGLPLMVLLIMAVSRS